jgi:hypothetical protein
MCWIGSAKFVSNSKNNFPFLLYPFTSVSEDTNILSRSAPEITRFNL